MNRIIAVLALIDYRALLVVLGLAVWLVLVGAGMAGDER